MRILHILWSAHFGGIERLVLDLATDQSTDHEEQTGILFGSEEGKGGFLKAFREAGLKCFFLHLNSGYDLSPRKYLSAFRTFREYDILHFHSFNPLLAACAVISDKKIVYTEHGNFGFGRGKTWADSIKTLLLKMFLKSGVDYITFNSKFTKQLAQKRYGLDSVKSSVVYNGIDSKMNSISTAGVEKSILQKIRGKFVIGTTSRFVGSKRIDRLIHAFADFQIDKDTVLLLLGDGALKDELEQLIEHLRLSGKIVFTGFRHNVREFQDLMDVCVFPFENEAFGLVAVETLSLGKPTIVFRDGGGIVEVIGGFSQDDVVEGISQLVERLEFYFYSRDEITKQAQGRKEYSKKFAINRMAAELDAIYKQILLCVE